MNIIDLPLALLGAMAGAIVWSVIAKILLGIFAAAKGASLNAILGDVADQKIRKIVAILSVASCVWISVFGSVATHFIRPTPSGFGSVWFFGGVAITPLFIWLPVLKVALKIEKNKQNRTQP